MAARADNVATSAPAVTAQESATGEAASNVAETLARAVEAYDRGELVEARKLFEAVHAAAPTARTLRSLGLLAHREQRFDDAVALLEASLASEIKPLTEAQRVGAIAVLNEARGKTVPVSDDAPPPPATALPGKNLPAVEQVARAPEAKPQPHVGQPLRPAHTARNRRLRRAGFALLGVAGAALIVGATSYGVALSRVHDIEDHCRDQPGQQCAVSDVQAREREAHLDQLGSLALASGIIAGVAGSAGTVVLLWNHLDKQPGQPARTALGLGWRASF